MNVRYWLCPALLVAALFQANSALLAQDVAAAARANRANHNNAASVKADSEGGGLVTVDALKTCVTDNTSGRDRKDLAKWVFFAMAAHPEMKQYADANAAAAADESSQKMAALITRLLTESCVSEVRAVMNTGQGSQSLKLAFETLGELAMQELMADESVHEAMSSFERYVDQARLKEALAGN
jgi:hypothetical protein